MTTLDVHYDFCRFIRGGLAVSIGPDDNRPAGPVAARPVRAGAHARAELLELGARAAMASDPGPAPFRWTCRFGA